jgi:hypothetical protein
MYVLSIDQHVLRCSILISILPSGCTPNSEFNMTVP